MAKNALGSDRRSETPSRSPSGKRRREKRRRSRSRSRRERDRSRSRGGKKSRSRSRQKKRAREGRGRSRSKDRGRKRSRSRKGGRSRSRRKKSASRKKSGSRKRSASKAAEKKRRSPSRKRSRSPSKAAEKKCSPSPKEDQRGSPSVKRGSPDRGKTDKGKVPPDKTQADAGKPDSEKSGSGDRSNGESTSKAAAPEAAKAMDAEAPKEAQPPKMEIATITFSARPFGMAPQKDPGVEGYVVAKVAEGRPADERGVQAGWRLVAVGGEACREQGPDAVQALLKAAPLPVDVKFERPAVEEEDAQSEHPAEEEQEEEKEDEEIDILDVRADQRRNQSSAMSNIDDLPVTREPEDLPNPITSWQDAVGKGMLNKALMEKLQAAGLKRPTLIQRHAVPVVCHQSGHYDLIAMAQTGSGKTFAFVIPTVSRLILQGAMPRPFFPGKSPGCPLLVVLSPTRELAMQTSKEIEVVAKGTSLTAVCIYGGESLKYQQQRIEKAQIDILCATPGRLIDLVDSGSISLSFVQSVILDEADQMLEQSLEVMCAEILTGRDMPEPSSGRQTLLFSATMPQKIRELCPRILRQERIANLTIGHYGEDQGGSCSSIQQILRWVPDEGPQRIQVLIEDLKTYWIRPGKKGRVVIFTNQRLQAAHLANALLAAGISCVHLHGKLEQHVREEVFDKFRRGMSDVLVATNVASRGLDFPDISLVVQFNLPQTVDIYTHRIGRTGRVGQVGCALGYMGPKDRRLNDKLAAFLEMNKQEIPDFVRPRMVSPRRRPVPVGRPPMGRSRSRRRR